MDVWRSTETSDDEVDVVGDVGAFLQDGKDKSMSKSTSVGVGELGILSLRLIASSCLSMAGYCVLMFIDTSDSSIRDEPINTRSCPCYTL